MFEVWSLMDPLRTEESHSLTNVFFQPLNFGRCRVRRERMWEMLVFDFPPQFGMMESEGPRFVGLPPPHSKDEFGKSRVELPTSLGCKGQSVSTVDFPNEAAPLVHPIIASEIRPLRGFWSSSVWHEASSWTVAETAEKTLGPLGIGEVWRSPWAPHELNIPSTSEYSMPNPKLMSNSLLCSGIRVVRRYQAEFGLSYRKMTLYLLFFSVLAVSHWLACTLGIVHKFAIESFGPNWSVCHLPEVHRELNPPGFNCFKRWLHGWVF